MPIIVGHSAHHHSNDVMNVVFEHIAVGGNRHPSAADYNSTADLLAFGADCNLALWSLKVALSVLIMHEKY